MNNYTNKHLFSAAFCISLFLTTMTCACNSSGKGKSNQDSTSIEEYHADNDIAMIAKSFADALVINEPLDTLENNFTGVLTDGEGHPLYTDIQGSPGIWNVNVTNPNTAVIRNVYLGDLLPGYLESYITTNLDLTEDDKIGTSVSDTTDNSQVTVYNLDGAYLRFEIRTALAPNGLEGPLLSIVLTTTPPLTL